MKKLVFIFMMVAIFAPGVSSAEDGAGDTVYLKSGGSITGIVTKEGKSAVEVETEGGSVVISRAQITRIEHAPDEALGALRAGWDRQRATLKTRSKESEAEREKRFREYSEWVAATEKKKGPGLGENEVQILRDPEGNSILVEALLNGDVKAMLIVDTGADITVLSKELGKLLGVDVVKDSGNDVGLMHLAGGKTVKARMVILKSLAIGGIEEKNVAAAVLLEEKEHLGFKDGLLGRSFLNRFNINIDLQKMKMTLKKLGK